ncbi:MAG TPA: hypothetical protein VH682_21655 [Gemmataceae bacterium]
MRSSRSLIVFRLLALLLLCSLVTSCGKSRFKPLYPVKGRVLVNGEPTADIDVRFHSLDDPDDQLVSPSGTTDKDGEFTLSTYNANDGVPAGSYAVTMIWLPKDKRGRPQMGKLAKINKLPMSYSDPKTSGFKVEITKGDNTLPPFELHK